MNSVNYFLMKNVFTPLNMEFKSVKISIAIKEKAEGRGASLEKIICEQLGREGKKWTERRKIKKKPACKFSKICENCELWWRESQEVLIQIDHYIQNCCSVSASLMTSLSLFLNLFTLHCFSIIGIMTLSLYVTFDPQHTSTTYTCIFCYEEIQVTVISCIFSGTFSLQRSSALFIYMQFSN